MLLDTTAGDDGGAVRSRVLGEHSEQRGFRDPRDAGRGHNQAELLRVPGAVRRSCRLSVAQSRRSDPRSWGPHRCGVPPYTER